MVDLANRKHALYRFFGAERKLLYVGITHDPGMRWRGHSEQVWWVEVESITIEWLPNRDAALAAEQIAIATEDPLFNVKHAGAGSERRIRQLKFARAQALTPRCCVSNSPCPPTCRGVLHLTGHGAHQCNCYKLAQEILAN